MWLEGKPGSGKSTLLKRITRNIRDTHGISPKDYSPDRQVGAHKGYRGSYYSDQNTIVAEFYYSFRGGTTETSHELMLRSLVYQIWSQNSRLFPVLQKRYRRLAKENENMATGKNSFWRYEELKYALQSLHDIDFPVKIYIIVDGMDESDNEKREDVLRFLPALAARSSQCIVKVLVASRPETTINLHLMQGRHIVLQQFNTKDIQIAINDGIDYLKSFSRDNDSSSDGFLDIAEYILENSEGVFLWVSLVLRDLERTIRKGAYTLDRLLRQVRTLPKDLGGPKGFYRLMVESMIRCQENDASQHDEEKEEDIKTSRRILNWVTFSRFPISIRELEGVLATPAECDIEPSNYSFEQHKPLDLERGIMSYCGGLVEVSIRILMVVSSRTHSNWWQARTSRRSLQLIHQTAREFLLDRAEPAKPYCLDEISGDGEIAATCFRNLKLVFLATLPQLEADENQEQLEKLTKYLETCTLLKYCFRHFVRHLELLGSLADDIRQDFEAFITALGTRPNSFASLLLLLWSKPVVSKPFEWMDSALLAARNCLQSVLLSAICSGRVRVVDMLIYLHADVNCCDKNMQYPLECAVRLGEGEIVHRLLFYGADANRLLEESDIREPSQNFGSVLEVASAEGFVAIVKELMNHGADINMAGGYYGSALQAASSNGHEEVVKILVDYGAEIDTAGRYYGKCVSSCFI